MGGWSDRHIAIAPRDRDGSCPPPVPVRLQRIGDAYRLIQSAWPMPWFAAEPDRAITPGVAGFAQVPRPSPAAMTIPPTARRPV